MAPYMSDRRSSPQLYQLYGVLVHQGHSVHSGHYYCFVRAANGLWLLAGVSLALAVFNLLPFLPLDGGHIFWALVEKARGGRKISLRTMERASYVGLALMLCLVVIGFSNDISTFVHGGNFLSTR